MSLQDIVKVTISLATGGASKAGFSTMLVAGYHTRFTERIKFYATLDAVAANFETTDPEYLAAAAWFSPTPRPTQIAIGRLQQDDLFIDLTGKAVYDDAHEYKVTIDGSDYTSTGAGSAALTIDALKTAIDAGGVYTVTKGTGASPDYMPVGSYKLVPVVAGSAHTVSFDTNQDWFNWLIVDLDGVGAWVATQIYELRINDVQIQIDSTGDANIDATVTKMVTAINTDAQVNAIAGATTTGIYYVYQKIGSARGTLGMFEIVDAYQSYSHGERAETWAAGITAIKEANDGWYGVGETTRFKQDQLDMAAKIETMRKLHAVASAEGIIASTTEAADTTSIAAQLKDGAYFRTAGFYHTKADGSSANEQWIEFAALAKLLTADPDVQTTILKFQTLPGITVDVLTSTERLNIIDTEDNPTSGKNFSIYTEVGGVNVIQSGIVSGGEWADIILGRDWLQARIEEDIYNALRQASAAGQKVPFSNDGIAVIENQLRSRLKFAIGTQFLRYDSALSVDQGFIVEVPDIADVPDTDIANRILKNVTFAATVAGAIQAVQITGTLGV